MRLLLRLKFLALCVRLFAEGSFSQAFVPVLSEYRTKCSHDDVRRFINCMSGTLGVVLFFVTIVAILASPLLIAVFAPGFLHNGARFVLTYRMLRITFPYLLFISLTALCSAVLNTYDSFGVPAFTPVLLNISIIVMAIFAAPHFQTPVYALCWAVFIAGMVQLAFQLPFLHKKKLMPIPKVNFKDPGVQRVLKLMVPALFGVSVVQLSLLIDTIFASFLKTGSISWLYYSNRLMNFPLGVFGVAIATVILPKLSRNFANKNAKDYSETLDWALRLLLLIGLPSSIAILILSGPLLATLFLGGNFKPFDVVMARQSLIAFAIGIQAFMLIKVFASAFYARQNIKTPVKIAVVAVIINMLLNAAFIVPLHHAGLALATSLAAFVNSGLLLLVLLRKKIYIPQAGWWLYGLRLLIANGALALFLFFMTDRLTLWFKHHWLWRTLHLSELVLIGALIYFVCLFISGLRLATYKIKQ